MSAAYWIVIGERGSSTGRYRHQTEQQAIDAAVRLTHEVGGKYTVFEAKFVAEKSYVKLTKLDTGDDITF